MIVEWWNPILDWIIPLLVALIVFVRGRKLFGFWAGILGATVALLGFLAAYATDIWPVFQGLPKTP